MPHAISPTSNSVLPSCGQVHVVFEEVQERHRQERERVPQPCAAQQPTPAPHRRQHPEIQQRAHQVIPPRPVHQQHLEMCADRPPVLPLPHRRQQFRQEAEDGSRQAAAQLLALVGRRLGGQQREAQRDRPARRTPPPPRTPVRPSRPSSRRRQSASAPTDGDQRNSAARSCPARAGTAPRPTPASPTAAADAPCSSAYIAHTPNNAPSNAVREGTQGIRREYSVASRRSKPQNSAPTARII
jgi:hypothetical protein